MNDILYQTSPIWKRIAKQTNDSVTDLVLLFAYAVKRKDYPNNYSQILTQGQHFFKPNDAGKDVERIIKETTLKKCQIDWYSINPNQLGKEKSCNNISLIVYSHWDTPCMVDEAKNEMHEEINSLLIEPIRKLLEKHNADITPSSYDHGNVISSWLDRDELLVGERNCNFTKGHF